MKFSLGIDPDLHDTGLALVAEDRVLAVGLARIPQKLKRDAAVLRMSAVLASYIPQWLVGLQRFPGLNPATLDVVVVEGQELYLGTSDAKPDSILRLAQVSGAALCVAQAATTPIQSFIPRPKVWKGSVPKGIHQGRILSRYGWKYVKKGSSKTQWCCPSSFGPYALLSSLRCPQGSWKHIVDAIGLARWGLQTTGVIER